MISRLRTFVPTAVLNAYHRLMAAVAALYYGHPSKELIVIGVTGTNGKSSTCYFLSHALEADGSNTGMTSTALFKIADKEWTNATKMTMLGRFALQRLLRRMVRAGCRYAVVETSSQGILQHRHANIAYDVCVFTNLTPEHIEAHGGFENYKRAKLQLFRHTVSLPRKTVNGALVPRFAVLNANDEHAKDFAISGFDRIVWYGLNAQAEIHATDLMETLEGVRFSVEDTQFTIHTPGRVMVENALAAIATVSVFGFDRSRVATSLANVHGMPGRYEWIDEGQPWTVIVDYAYEPAALTHLFDHVTRHKSNGRIIHLTGSAGGGRDVARRNVIGRLSAMHADITIVTNEDPYDDDPQTIIDAVADAARDAGAIENETLFRISDRREAIRKAMQLARSNDIVLITGKGNEPVMAVAGGKKIPMDDREDARKAIRQVMEDATKNG